MDMKISVIICTYNGASRLPATLEKLAAQTVPAEWPWEVILIDNASTDDTAAVARQIGTNFPVPLRILQEPQPGKANALQTAFREAAGEYYCIVDDDNLLESDYLTNGMKFLNQHPDVALIGGRTLPEFPVGIDPPSDFDVRFAHFLACYDHGTEIIWDKIPPGAGQMGRVFLMRGIYEHIGTWLGDRIGDGVGCCEDLEKGHVCQRLGWQTAHVPQLVLHHVMASRRLTEEYIDTLTCTAYSLGPWLYNLAGSETGTSWAGSAALLVSDLLRVGKYTLLIRFPKFHPKIRRAPFWYKVYSSRLASRLALLRDRKLVWAHINRINSAPRELRPRALRDAPLPAPRSA